MSEYSPTPWKLAVTGYDSAGKFLFRVLDDNEPIPPGLTLTAVDANGKALEEDFFVGENWPHIVKCVNLHDQLVAVCTALLREAYPNRPYGPTPAFVNLELSSKGLLAKAKGEA